MAESEMVERVARAICATYGIDPNHVIERGYDECVGQEKTIRRTIALPSWMSFRAQARTAIATMREPTMAMIEAGVAECMCRIEDCAVIWRAMIDAALG